MLKLYEIPEEYRKLMAQVDEANGELTSEMEESLNAIEANIEAKVDGVVTLIKEAEGESASFAAEIKRLQERKKACDNRAKNLASYVIKTMDQIGMDKVKTTRFTVAPQFAGRPSISWTGLPEEIPDEFKRTKHELDGNAAFEAWKLGVLNSERFEVQKSRFLSIR
jgi:hypothetical protein